MSKSAHGSALPRTNAMRMLDAARIPYEVLTYEVDQISIVLPTETDNLKVVDGKDYVTLMTCTPLSLIHI